MTSQINDNDIKKFRSIFDSLDLDHTMKIERKQMIESLIKLGFPVTYAEKIFNRMDAHHSGSLSFDDFCLYMYECRAEHKLLFDKVNSDKSGLLSHDDLKNFIFEMDGHHLKPNEADVDKLFFEIHHDNKGGISFEEFENIFGMLKLQDVSYLYSHSYSMFDGGSPGLVADYHSLSQWLGLSWLHVPHLPSVLTGSVTLQLRMLTAGIAGGMAQSVVNPFETIKVRLQTEGGSAVKKYKSFANGFKVILSEEGVRGLWKGTVPAICRELIYTSSRMGLYKPIKDSLLSLQGKSRKPGPERIWEKLVGGGAAGGIAAFIGNPSDLIKARMQADETGKLSTTGHLKQILRERGPLGLWTGASATVTRAVTLGSVKMATYDEAKGGISKFLGCRPSDVRVVVLGSITSSFCLTLAVAPVDLVRTRIMTAADGCKGGAPAAQLTMAGVFADVVRKEGPAALFKGFFPLWARNGPYNILQFLIWEQLCRQVNISVT